MLPFSAVSSKRIPFTTKTKPTLFCICLRSLVFRIHHLLSPARCLWPLGDGERSMSKVVYSSMIQEPNAQESTVYAVVFSSSQSGQKPTVSPNPNRRQATSAMPNLHSPHSTSTSLITHSIPSSLNMITLPLFVSFLLILTHPNC